MLDTLNKACHVLRNGNHACLEQFIHPQWLVDLFFLLPPQFNQVQSQTQLMHLILRIQKEDTSIYFCEIGINICTDNPIAWRDKKA